MRYIKQLTTIILFCLMVYGCNNAPSVSHRHNQNCKDIFILDFTGGTSRLWYLGLKQFGAIDFSRFQINPTDTLDDIEDFPEMIRAQVEIILLDADLKAEVVIGEQEAYINVVHFSMITDYTDNDEKTTLGRGHYDICNLSHRNQSLIYCETLATLQFSLSVEKWVLLFANIAAHEIGHNLGFYHVDLEDVPNSVFNEIMIGSQPYKYRLKEQRILVEQNTCPLNWIGHGKEYVEIDMPCGVYK